jgi:co-chaperonin GroES (HSP10)
MSIYQAKKTGNTPSGSKYIILQDGPKSFHVSVGNGDNVIYDHFHDPPSLEFLDNNILLLEQELLSKAP